MGSACVALHRLLDWVQKAKGPDARVQEFVELPQSYINMHVGSLCHRPSVWQYRQHYRRCRGLFFGSRCPAVRACVLVCAVEDGFLGCVVHAAMHALLQVPSFICACLKAGIFVHAGARTHSASCKAVRAAAEAGPHLRQVLWRPRATR
jgi:hypothetical protein